MQSFTEWRTTAVIAAAALMLSGCTSQLAAPSTSPGNDGPTPTASSSASDAERFASMDERVAAAYSDRQPAGTFAGEESREIELPASGNADTKMVVLMLTCTGSGEYSITVEQTHPNTVGATCGDTGTSIAAVPLDSPDSPTALDVKVPDGTSFWLSTYYTSEAADNN